MTALTFMLGAWVNLWHDPAPLLNILLRSGLLLAAALVVAALPRGGRPEARVLIYRAALLCTVGIALLGLAPNVARWNIALYSTPALPPASQITATTPKARAPIKHHSPASEQRIASGQVSTSAPLTLPKETANDNRIDLVLTLLVGVWPLVSGGLLLRLLWCHARIVWLRRRAQVIRDQEVLASLRTACAALGVKTPDLRCSPKAHGPFLCGIWRPMLLLPVDYAEQFDAVALRAIFLHEAAHIRGRDCAWTYARRIICALLWPQPLLWVLSRQMEVAAEDACDLAVLEGGCAPRDYARCLVDLAERLCLTRAERAVGAGVLPRRSILPRRVKQILKGLPKAPRPKRGTRWMIAGATVCLCAGSIAFAIDTNTPLGAAGDISGRVVYEDGRPAAGIGIAASMRDADESRVLSPGILTRRVRNMLAKDATTAADGTYHIKNLLAGATFNVMVHNDLFAPTGEAGPPGWVGAAQVIKPRRDQNTKVQDIVLTRGALIEGQIEDAISGKPLANMSIGCHGPHRPLSTGFITYTHSDANGRFTLRVPPGKNWVYWNGPVQNLRAEVHLGTSPPYEKDLSVVRSGDAIYGDSDFVEVRVDAEQPQYTRSGNGGMRDADSITLTEGQTRHMTFRLSPLHIKERPGKTPIVVLSEAPPLPGSTPVAWNPNAKLPSQGMGALTGRVTFPNGKPAAGVALIIQMQDRAVAALPDVPAVYSEQFDRLSRTQKAMLKQNVVTASDGTYRVTGLLDAPYDVVYTPNVAPPLSNWIGAPRANITVKPNQTAQVPTMVLQHGTLIQGQITDAASKRGLPSVFLEVDDNRRPASIPMSELFDANKNGHFSMRVLPGQVSVGLNFYDATFGQNQTIRLGSRQYDLAKTTILANGQPQKSGSVAKISTREGQSLTLDFQLKLK